MEMAVMLGSVGYGQLVAAKILRNLMMGMDLLGALFTTAN
jgi:hypothetical protein